MINDSSVEQLVDQISKKDARTFRLTVIYALIAFIVGSSYIIYVFLAIQSLDREIQSRKDVLIALNPLLKDFGWPQNKTSQKTINTTLIKESLLANSEINVILSRRTKAKYSKTIIVQYFPKDIDGNKVTSAFDGYGFIVQIKNPLIPDLPTNSIFFGKNVNPEDAKLVAYTLIRAGVEIKGIYYSLLGDAKKTVVQVVANREILNKPPLSVEQIKNMKNFAYSNANNW
jgi:hypothetical protein